MGPGATFGVLIVTNSRTALTIVAGALLSIGVVLFLFGEFLVAGLCFLLVSMTIYVRGTRT